MTREELWSNQNGESVNYFKEYNAPIVDIALEHKDGYLVVDTCSKDVIDDSEILYLIYKNENMPEIIDKMPMSICSDINPEEYDDWFKETIYKYGIIDKNELFDFGKLKKTFYIKATYDENGYIVEQQLVEFE